MVLKQGALCEKTTFLAARVGFACLFYTYLYLKMNSNSWEKNSLNRPNTLPELVTANRLENSGHFTVHVLFMELHLI
jgi:hypothetical protein